MSVLDPHGVSTSGGGSVTTVTVTLFRRAAAATATAATHAVKSAVNAKASAAADGETEDTEPPTDDSGSDNAGNTIFFICIAAFITTALGLGVFVWRKHSQNKQASQDGGVENGKKGKPARLVLTTFNSSDTSLPPYSLNGDVGDLDAKALDLTPQAATRARPLSAAQSAALADAQALSQGLSIDTESQVAGDDKSGLASRLLGRIASVSRHNRERESSAEQFEEPPATPFSPFAPFSPVSGNFGPYSAPAKGNLTHSPYRPSGLHVSSTYDPETAQDMGIHASVLSQAESGVTEEEIERRRLRAQKRLESRQRSEEGRLDHGETDSVGTGFRSLARSREVRN